MVSDAFTRQREQTAAKARQRAQYIVDQMASGRSQADIARELGVSRQMIYKVLRRFNGQGLTDD